MKALMRTAVIALAVALLILAVSSLHLVYSPSDAPESRRNEELQRLERARMRLEEGRRQTVQEWAAQRCTLAETMQRWQELDREFGQEWPAYNTIALKTLSPSDEERRYHLIRNYAVVVLRGRPQELPSVLRRLKKAFAEEPKLADDVGTTYRFKAACAAALLQCGQRKDADKLDAPERARLRKQALDWLRADVEEWRKLLDKEMNKARPSMRLHMQIWLAETDTAGLREPEALAQMPEAERKEWHKFWQEVEALRQRAAPPSKTTNAARP